MGEPNTSSRRSSGRAVAAVVDIHRRLAAAGHEIPVRLWEGTQLGPVDAGYRLVLRRPWSLRAVLVPGTDLAVGEAYLADVVDVEGSMVGAMAAVADLRAGGLDLTGRFGLAAQVMRLPRPPRLGPRPRARLGRLLADVRRHLLPSHSTARDRQAVRFHYDTGNEFFATFLDRGLVYSCAYFPPGATEDPTTAADDALEVAQQRKLELVCRKLGLQPGMRLLDVGCGWGSLVIHAATHHGVEATGVTLSPAQAQLARARVEAAGLSDSVEIRIADYRELDGRWDAIASVGMVEHVGPDQLAAYFEVLRDSLQPGGRLLNHGITTGLRPEARDFARIGDSFLARHVFPDGGLVPTATMVRHAEAAGLEVGDVQQLRPHYALTLRHWVHRLEAAHDAAVSAASETAFRVWRAYMAAAAVGFTVRDLGVVQLLCTRDADLPFGRAWMEPDDVHSEIDLREPDLLPDRRRSEVQR